MILLSIVIDETSHHLYTIILLRCIWCTQFQISFRRFSSRRNNFSLVLSNSRKGRKSSNVWIIYSRVDERRRWRETGVERVAIRISRHETVGASLLSRLPRILRRGPGLGIALISVVNSYQDRDSSRARTHRTTPLICDPAHLTPLPPFMTRFSEWFSLSSRPPVSNQFL